MSYYRAHERVILSREVGGVTGAGGVGVCVHACARGVGTQQGQEIVQREGLSYLSHLSLGYLCSSSSLPSPTEVRAGHHGTFSLPPPQTHFCQSKRLPAQLHACAVAPSRPGQSRSA